MNILIVDDEKKSRETLQSLVEGYCPGVSVTGLAADVDSAVMSIAAQPPDVVLLDISMPGGNGFELIKKVKNITFEIIFVTAYDSYGIEAIKANALDYLLKPVSVEELRNAVEKARKKLSQRNSPMDFSQLLQQMDFNPVKQKIAIPASDGLIFIAPVDIVSLMADGSYTTLTLSTGKKVVSTRHLKEYEDQLPATYFLRVHHSHIINLEHVKQYHRGEGGYVEMSDGSEIMISKRKKKDFLGRF